MHPTELHRAEPSEIFLQELVEEIVAAIQPEKIIRRFLKRPTGHAWKPSHGLIWRSNLRHL